MLLRRETKDQRRTGKICLVSCTARHLCFMFFGKISTNAKLRVALATVSVLRGSVLCVVIDQEFVICPRPGSVDMESVCKANSPVAVGVTPDKI